MLWLQKHNLLLWAVELRKSLQVNIDTHIYGYLTRLLLYCCHHLHRDFCQQAQDLSTLIAIYGDQGLIYTDQYPCRDSIDFPLAQGRYLIEVALVRGDIIMAASARTVVIRHEVSDQDLYLSSFDCGRLERTRKTEDGYAPIEVPSHEMCQEYTR